MGPDPDDLIGQVLASRYRLEARLGNGAMGIVYRARHVKVGRLFAVKVLHPQLLDDAKLRRRFAREAELAGSLNHPNLVSVVDVGETPDGLHYLVMEYAEGHTLFELICPGAPWPTARVTAMVRQLCDGLAHAHERGLIHRDFKTENVIVERRDGREIPRIADFGIAILRDEAASPSADRLTTAGMVLGTPSYMAPEQATGGGLDHRVDLFALGVMCFEMLAGCAPFEGDGVDIARANLLSETPVMAVRVPGLVVDRMLEGLTRKLMMKSRDARPESARAVRELLDLIERDRRAAAAALGIAVSERGAALTEPVGAQPTPAQWSPEAATARMKPTPPANPPSHAAVEPSAARSPTDLEIPGGAALGTEAQRPTTLRTPLSWESAPASRRRRSWLLAGLALGAAGITAGWIVATSSSDDDPGTRIVMTPVRPAPPPPSTPPTAPIIEEKAPPAPVLTTAELAPTPPAHKVDDRKRAPTVASEPKADARLDRKPPEPRRVLAEPRPAEPRPAEPRVDARASERKPESKPAEPRVDARASERKPEPKPAEHASEPKPAEPRADPVTEPPTGMTPKQLSDLWASVAQELGRLPSGSADDLWTRFRVFKIQALMAAPALDRDAAAKQLWQIHQEAARRR
jgi:serine/threonine protein kinase